MTRSASRRKKVLKYIAQNSGTTFEGFISTYLGLSGKAAFMAVSQLLAQGLVNRGWDGKSLEITNAGWQAIKWGIDV